ncbi:MAG TPA: adenylate/guanylate cyclase domain-containing protein [Abditibacteriaceae bacterium]|jgi:adenylate cyclase
MRPVLIAFFCTLLALAARPLLSPLDGRVYDSGLVSRAPRPASSIAILGIDENFMQGRHVYLTPRARLAKLIDTVSQGKPRAIALDVWLDSRVDEKADAALRNALRTAKARGVPVILADVERDVAQSGTTRTGVTAHGSVIPYFASHAQTASVTFVPDADNVVRSIAPSDFVPLPLAAAKYLGGTVEIDRTPPLPALIDFRGEKAIPITPAVDFLAQPFLAALLENKVVFIGAVYPRSFDFLQTPYSFNRPPRERYGVEVLAHATLTAHSLLLGAAPRRIAPFAALAAATFLVALGVALAAWKHAALGAFAVVAVVIGVLALGFASARGGWSWVWPPSAFVVAAVLSGGLGAVFHSWQQSQQLRVVRETFGAYVGDEVLETLGGKLPEMGGEVRNIAVLFCDIRGYSALAERLQNDPAKLMLALNEHFEPLVDALKKRGAYADNYVGDLVMALFGAPVSQGPEADAKNAVAAAHDFVRLVGERNDLRRAAGEEPIEVGVGLHCGEAVVGNLGSKRKIHYTAIGDVVNIASRVESATRKYDVPLLVTEEIVQTAGGEWEFVEETTVKGRATPVRLYRAL